MFFDRECSGICSILSFAISLIQLALRTTPLRHSKAGTGGVKIITIVAKTVKPKFTISAVLPVVERMVKWLLLN